MNTERLHTIAIAVLDDIKTTKLRETLKQLVGALQNQISQPQAPQFQPQVSEHLKTLYASLSAAPSNDFSPAWKQALQELGLDGLLGKSLQVRIEGIFERHPITLSIALEELSKLQNQLTSYGGALEQIVSGFKQMNIGAEELEPGQCEIGVIIPRSAIQNKLGEFADDLEDLDGIFGTFAELTTGESPPGFEIRSVSSSELSVFLEMLPIVAASIALSVERLVKVYKDILEIIEKHRELRERGVTKNQLKGVEEHIDQRMKDEIEKLTKELLKKYKVKDEPRRNELRNAVKLSLNKIANRIDKRYSFEIRAKPISDEEAAEKGTAPEDKEYINAVISASKNVEFLKPGGPPILSLPESQENNTNQG